MATYEQGQTMSVEDSQSAPAPPESVEPSAPSMAANPIESDAAHPDGHLSTEIGAVPSPKLELEPSGIGPLAAPTPPQRQRRLRRLLIWAGLATADSPDFLEDAELRERLRLHSKGLVNQIYEISLRVLDGDVRRESALDSKATGLLGAVGLSLTVAFTFGGVLIEHPERFSQDGLISYKIIVGLYGLSLASGLLAGLWALRALKVQLHQSIDERDFLNPVVLAESDTDNSDDEDKKITYYKRYLAAHYIRVYHENSLVHDRKAATIHTGQIFFFVFLTGIFLISASLVNLAFIRSTTATNIGASQSNSGFPHTLGPNAAASLGTSSIIDLCRYS